MVYANDMLAGLTVRFGGLVTVSVTDTVCGLLEAPLALTLTVPV
jgi:hypothetical protein